VNSRPGSPSLTGKSAPINGALTGTGNSTAVLFAATSLVIGSIMFSLDCWALNSEAASVERTLPFEDGTLITRSFKSKSSGHELIPAKALESQNGRWRT